MRRKATAGKGKATSGRPSARASGSASAVPAASPGGLTDTMGMVGQRSAPAAAIDGVAVQRMLGAARQAEEGTCRAAMERARVGSIEAPAVVGKTEAQVVSVCTVCVDQGNEEDEIRVWTPTTWPPRCGGRLCVGLPPCTVCLT